MNTQQRKVSCMRRQEVSIEDIARAADVSHSTVSRALRNSSLISVDVRERIQQLAREMGYTPNAIAQSLLTRQTSTIGLVVTSISDPFWGVVMKGVEEVARAAGFSVFLSASHNDPDEEIAILETFHRRRLQGILVAGQTSLPGLLDTGVTAIFCYNDAIAAGVLIACREQGIAVPQGLSVIGFDNIKMASYLTPPLTTIHQPKIEMGRLATQVLLDLLHNRPVQNYVLPPALISRASTAPLAQR